MQNRKQFKNKLGIPAARFIYTEHREAVCKHCKIISPVAVSEGMAKH